MSQYRAFGFPETIGPNRQRLAQLEDTARIRREQPQRDVGYMAPMASIPPLDYAVLIRRFPDLISKDAQIMKRAWDTFMASPYSDPYRVKDRVWRPITEN